jgi:hypothetical protein
MLMRAYRLGQHITDYGDGADAAYGPLNVRALRKNDPAAARLNADNYRWYAQEVYWSNKCSRVFSVPRNGADAGDDACGGRVCRIM